MRDLQWWCAAVGESWSWEWRGYPGVWLFVVSFAALYWRFGRSGGGKGGFSAAAGILLLWLSLDWPVGALGSGYLASVHSFQFVMLAMVVPILLLGGVTDSALRRLEDAPVALRVMRFLTNPTFAATLFTLVMVATHAAPVLDALKVSQTGSFALDLAWLVSGILMAWPLLCRVPHRPGFGPPLQILYVFLGTVAHVFIGMWLLAARFPVYATYELAPRVVDQLSPLSDQHLAGAVILLLGSPIVLIAITAIFFRWQGTGAEQDVGSGA